MSRKITLTYDQAKADLEALAAEHPEYVYQRPEDMNSCAYFNADGSPGCIVGHLAAKHGATLEEWRDINEDSAVTSIFDDVIIAADDSERERLRSLLNLAQAEQDAGKPWEVAVSTAIEAVEEG